MYVWDPITTANLINWLAGIHLQTWISPKKRRGRVNLITTFCFGTSVGHPHCMLSRQNLRFYILDGKTLSTWETNGEDPPLPVKFEFVNDSSHDFLWLHKINQTCSKVSTQMRPFLQVGIWNIQNQIHSLVPINISAGLWVPKWGKTNTQHVRNQLSRWTGLLTWK